MNGSVLTDVKTVVEIIAFFAAGCYFIYKLIDGWGLVNLSLELSAGRQKCDETDLVAVVLKLSKGDQGSLGLHTAELRCSVGPGYPEVFRIPLIYPLKLRTEGTHTDRHSLV